MKFKKSLRWIMIFVTSAFLLNCENTKDVISDAPLSENKMKAVLIDLYIAEAAADLQEITNDSLLLPHKSYYYDDIFKNHQITKEQYDKAYEYYTSKPKVLLKIYEEMKTDLEALEISKTKKPELK